jgi:hypothetical protein
MEDVVIFNGNLVYFMAIKYILWAFGTFCGNFLHFPRFGMLYIPRKIWQPCITAQKHSIIS